MSVTQGNKRLELPKMGHKFYTDVYTHYMLLRPIGYFRFELNVWVVRSFLGARRGLFLTFWKVTGEVSRR